MIHRTPTYVSQSRDFDFLSAFGSATASPRQFVPVDRWCSIKLSSTICTVRSLILYIWSPQAFAQPPTSWFMAITMLYFLSSHNTIGNGIIQRPTVARNRNSMVQSNFTTTCCLIPKSALWIQHASRSEHKSELHLSTNPRTVLNQQEAGGYWKFTTRTEDITGREPVR